MPLELFPLMLWFQSQRRFFGGSNPVNLIAHVIVQTVSIAEAILWGEQPDIGGFFLAQIVSIAEAILWGEQRLTLELLQSK